MLGQRRVSVLVPALGLLALIGGCNSGDESSTPLGLASNGDPLNPPPAACIGSGIESVESLEGCSEQTVSEEGEVEILASLGEGSAGETTEYFFTPDNGRKRKLHFSGDAPDLLTGDRIRIRGTSLAGCGAEAAVAEPTFVESDSVELIQATPPASGFGAQDIGVVLLNFSDATNPYNAAKVQDIVFNKTHNFWLENSFGQTSVTGQTYGPYTISLSKSGCDTASIASLADAAASRAGISLTKHRRIMYVFPKNGCTFYGRANVGGNPSRSWINGSLVLHTVAHELGHNLGLYHSNALNCGSSAIGSSCSSIEYGDTTDIMGNKLAGHYTAFQKERLGWLNYGNSPSITTVNSSGSFTLDPYSGSSGGVKALKVLKSTNSSGQKTYYYVEYRQPTGFDAVLAGSSTYNLTSGVVIHTGSESSASSSSLLNMNPTSGSWYKSALNVGQSFQDSTAGVRITLSSANASGATVSVSLGGTPVPNPTPTPSQSLALNATVNKPMVRKNENIQVTLRGSTGSGTISGATYNLVLRDPTGRTLSQTGTLSSTGSATETFSVGPCSPTGNYQVSATITKSGANASDTTLFSVQ